MILGTSATFLAAVATIVLVYLWVVNAMITAQKKAFISTLTQLFINNSRVTESLGVSIFMLQKYSAKMIELHGTDFIDTEHFTEAEANLLRSIINAKVI